MRKIEERMIRAIQNKENWKSGNTSVSYEEGNEISRVYLHGNKIAEVGKGFVTLYDGGYRSNTTKSRINIILRENGGGGVYQKNYEWFVYSGADIYDQEFINGMTLY